MISPMVSADGCELYFSRVSSGIDKLYVATIAQ
jgi:hypothetical protein